jgi:hypothetical protein
MAVAAGAAAMTRFTVAADAVSFANSGFGNALNRFYGPFVVTPWGTADNQSP